MSISVEYLIIFFLLICTTYLLFKTKNTSDNNHIDNNNDSNLEELKDAINSVEQLENMGLKDEEQYVL